MIPGELLPWSRIGVAHGILPGVGMGGEERLCELSSGHDSSSL